jgi:hypothetical protein
MRPREVYFSPNWVAADLRSSDPHRGQQVDTNDDSADSKVGAVALCGGRRDLAAGEPAGSEASRGLIVVGMATGIVVIGVAI